MSGSAPAIELRGLAKTFGDQTALDGVDLTVAEGSIYGFLGPNGAGKTTTLRILTGMARPSAGGARVLGHDIAKAPDHVCSEIGFLPDVPGFYPWMTAREFLEFVGQLFGLPPAIRRPRVDHLLESSGLAGVHTRVGGFSRGMKQRLGIAQALMNAPRLLLLDEPTSALDPLGRKAVLEMIEALRGRATVFFSSHILADVERVCDTVAILHRGRVVAESTVQDLKASTDAHRIVVVLDGSADVMAARLGDAPWAGEVATDGNRVTLTVSDLDAAQRGVPQIVTALGMGLRHFQVEEQSIEDVFVSLIEDGPR